MIVLYGVETDQSRITLLGQTVKHDINRVNAT